MGIRSDILKEFEVNRHGIIKSPGKFEGEMLYAPYFYGLMLEGGLDETLDHPEGPIEIAIISSSDRKEFPEIGDIYALALWESDQGFVYIKEFDDKIALDHYREEVGDEAEEMYEEIGED